MPNLQLPGNPRYQPKQLQCDFGYDHLINAAVEVEIATLRTLADIGVIPQQEIGQLTKDVEAKLFAITTTEVDKLEREVTKHDIRALVQIMKEHLPSCLRRWVHVPLTSYDVLDTANILRFRRAHARTVQPLTDKVIDHLMEKVREFADAIQIGRTHGQHALPITVGFCMATWLSRIISNIADANEAASNLAGKISGPVGAYNAQVGLGFAGLCGETSFEVRVLEKLGLKPARISTQILPPEPLAKYLYACVNLSASLGQIGLDCRQLMRTEIAELCEPFDKGQVGSSTMAHKRNPMTFENLEGTWKKNKAEFGKVLETMTSEHQRDLVGSSISRDFPTIVVNLVLQLNTLLREKDGKSFIQRITVDEEACKRNFAHQDDVILAEPIYIALQMAGYDGDAHELVNHKAMPHFKEFGYQGISLLEATRLFTPPEVWRNIPQNTLEMLQNPEMYTGAAANKARSIAMIAEGYLFRSEQMRRAGA